MHSISAMPILLSSTLVSLSPLRMSSLVKGLRIAMGIFSPLISLASGIWAQNLGGPRWHTPEWVPAGWIQVGFAVIASQSLTSKFLPYQAIVELSPCVTIHQRGCQAARLGLPVKELSPRMAVHGRAVDHNVTYLTPCPKAYLGLFRSICAEIVHPLYVKRIFGVRLVRCR
ncbi:uncharacterized protein F4807DRAFT_59035 [Annulohypoxylon truncatum]|uniref:uncharacterized protein n=1 Tax=Annulohypoxylon truncatum TaxID=327061 RepID=UPI0020074FE4|nr:uncharacterized protein F4807DRAFT_59035 [Annulohypoxylon truncatum]KAI1210800.1 hypothetical protein F4807DRAFT_59035 [Annulohypoxylon truncatum]